MLTIPLNYAYWLRLSCGPMMYEWNFNKEVPDNISQQKGLFLSCTVVTEGSAAWANYEMIHVCPNWRSCCHCSLSVKLLGLYPRNLPLITSINRQPEPCAVTSLQLQCLLPKEAIWEQMSRELILLSLRHLLVMSPILIILN